MVTTLPSTIVEKPFVYPVAMAARTDLPARTSSLIRSKMTMFASAATPIVRIRPAKPGRVSVTLKMQDRPVEEDAVDGEPEDRDDAEEAVRDQQERATAMMPTIPAIFASWSESSPSVAEMSGALELGERVGQRAGLEDEREVLRLAGR